MAVASARKSGERREVRRAVAYLSAPPARMQMRETGKESGA
jgi:hypothetical protein